MTSDYAFSRRSLLKLGAAMLASPGTGDAATEGQENVSGVSAPEIFRAELVPDGADCRLAFVSDHHWWPEHLENWGGGAQMTSLSDRKMPDLAAMLNAERPDLSIHAGDVISAAGSFFPTPAEYAKQLAFAKRFYGLLDHPSIATVGNHETLEAHYGSHDQLRDWRRLFGAPVP